MSARKNLKWICRRCVAKQKGLEIEKDTELEKKGSFCGTMTWCFLVASSRLVREVAESKTPTIAPLDTNPEAELPEESEAIVEVAETALEEILEDMLLEEKRPEETPVEAEPEVSAEEAAELAKNMDLALKEQIEAQLAKEAEEARNADIARLEAELEALKK